MSPRDQQFDRAVALVHAGRVPEAASLLDQLALTGDAQAIHTLAEMKWAGILPPDQVGARALFERAGAAGDAEAAHRATNLMASGIAGPRDWARALDRLRTEAVTDQGRERALALVEQMRLDPDGDPLEAPAGRRLSESPNVTLFERAFSAGECEYLLALAGEAFAPATVYDSKRKLVRDPIRTSDQAPLAWLIEDPAVHALNRRLAAISGTAVEQGEAGQVLRYRPGQEYRAHFDFQIGVDNQRILTALVYLNDGYGGGETTFLKTGLKVRAATGDAIVFANTLPDGRGDDMAQHAGLPVVSGVKFLLSRWIRARRWAP